MAILETIALVSGVLQPLRQLCKDNPVAGKAASKLWDRGFSKTWTAGHSAFQKIRDGLQSLDLPENQVLLRAVVDAYWKSVSDVTILYGRAHQIDIGGPGNALGLPKAIQLRLLGERPLGVLAAGQEPNLRAIHDHARGRLAQPLTVASEGTQIDQILDELERLFVPGAAHARTVAEIAFDSLPPERLALGGEFKAFFLEEWHEFLEINFQSTVQQPGAQAHQLFGQWLAEIRVEQREGLLLTLEKLDEISRQVTAIGQGRTVSDADHEADRQRYLRGVLKHHKDIHFTGFAEVTGQPDIGLEDAFVMRRVVEPRTELREEPEPVEASILTTGAGPDRAVLLGKPGAGKTTLLEWLVLRAAHAAIKENGPLPVFCRVRDPVKDCAEIDLLQDCLPVNARKNLQAPVHDGFFEREARSHGLILLLDGLDEAGSAERRAALVKQVDAFRP